MNAVDNSQITLLLSSLATQVPIILVCLAAAVMTVLRWNDLSKSAVWALAGFGLAVILSIIIPITQVGMQQWLLRGGTRIGAGQTRLAFAVMGFLWSILRAMTYALLAIAVFAGRRPATVDRQTGAG